MGIYLFVLKIDKLECKTCFAINYTLLNEVKNKSSSKKPKNH
jgi:hypothetical protein